MKKPKVTAIIGTYRRGGIVDAAVGEILAAAEKNGAETSSIYLMDRRIEFCTNCRTCTQKEGRERGVCPLADDMADILDLIEQSDSIILASPMNFGTVTAVMKRFIERLVCYAWWPWGKPAPKLRNKLREKRAVLVASSAAPALLARTTSSMGRLLKDIAGLLGARPVGTLYIGLAALKQHQDIGRIARMKARYLGRKLAKERKA